MSRPQLPRATAPLTGKETVRVGVDGMPMLTTAEEVAATGTKAAIDAVTAAATRAATAAAIKAAADAAPVEAGKAAPGAAAKAVEDYAKANPPKGRVLRSGTFTTPASGTFVVMDVPASATIIKVSPRTDGAVQRSITRDGTSVTVSFRVLRTGVLSGILSSLFEQTSVVTFDFEASEPVAPMQV